MVIVSLIGYYITKKIIYGIKEVVEGAEEIEHGDYNVDIKVESDNEIGKLARTLNNMAENVSLSIYIIWKIYQFL
jgi:nitrate/nitrite-specific signal transduction histidine kinase